MVDRPFIQRTERESDGRSYLFTFNAPARGATWVRGEAPFLDRDGSHIYPEAMAWLDDKTCRVTFPVDLWPKGREAMWV